ncbi:hypothetical protein CF635_003524 [Enterobacter hormaechei]|nr:hypothetical protein [Enterobacter hormaechei]
MSSLYPVISLEIDLDTSEDIIPADILQSIIDANSFVIQKKEKAANYLQKAREERWLYKAQLQNELEKIKQLALDDLEETLDELRSKAISEAVAKLKSDAEHEKALFKSVIGRVSEELKKALYTVMPDVPWADLLTDKINGIIQNFTSTMHCVVKVGPENYAHLKKNIDMENVEIIEVLDLPVGKAVIETPDVMFSIDYDTQVTQLIDYLNCLQRES